MHKATVDIQLIASATWPSKNVIFSYLWKPEEEELISYNLKSKEIQN